MISKLSSKNQQLIQTAMAFATVVVSALLLTRGIGLEIAIVPILFYMIMLIAPKLDLKLLHWSLLALIAPLFLLDSAGFAFNEYEPFTEILGAATLFNGALPGLSLVEGMFLGIAGLAAARALGTHKAPFGGSQFSIPLELILMLVASFCAFLFLFGGLLSGGNASYAAMQVKSFILLPASLLTGYILFDSAKELLKVFYILTAAMIFKSLQGLYVFFVPYSGTMGSREFLLEHYTSDFIATAVTLLVLLFLKSQKSFGRRLLFLYPIPPMLFAYLLNDRRASLVGVVLGLIMLTLAQPIEKLKRAIPRVGAVFLMVIVFLGATWNISGPLGVPARSIQTILTGDAPPGGVDYRKLENYNMYLNIAERPFHGLGFGNRIPFPFQSFDWSKLFDNFNITPHNSFLALWALGGPFTLAAFALFITSCLALLVRNLSRPLNTEVYILAALGITMVPRWLLFVIADVGLGEFRCTLLVGLLIGGLARIHWQTSLSLQVSESLLPRVNKHDSESK